MSQPSPHSRAVSQLMAAALLWSLGGLLIKGINWSPLAIAGGRGLLAALFLLLVNRGLNFRLDPTRWIAALGYAGCTVFFVAATKYTTAANAILLQYTAPVWIALFGASLLGERTTRADWLAIVIAFAGMGLFFAGDLQASGLIGNVFGFVSGICFAVMTLALRRRKDASAVEPIIMGNLLAFAAGLPFMFTSPLPAPSGLGLLLVLGVVQLGCSYWLYSRAIRQVSALEAVIIPVFEPILNPVWVFLFQGERPASWALLGGVLVLGTAVWRAVHALRLRPA